MPCGPFFLHKTLSIEVKIKEEMWRGYFGESPLKHYESEAQIHALLASGKPVVMVYRTSGMGTRRSFLTPLEESARELPDIHFIDCNCGKHYSKCIDKDLSRGPYVEVLAQEGDHIRVLAYPHIIHPTAFTSFFKKWKLSTHN